MEENGGALIKKPEHEEIKSRQGKRNTNF